MVEDGPETEEAGDGPSPGDAEALEAIRFGWGDGGRDRPRDAASLGEITTEMLRDTFPYWRVFESGGVWWAVRSGPQEKDGPGSLLLRVIGAPDLTGLAEKLCLQEWLDGLSPDGLGAVWRDVALPGVSQ